MLASDKKPIRVFLCDGRNDNRGIGRGGVYDETRDWFFQNVRLMKALTAERLRRELHLGHELHGQKLRRGHPAGHDALAVAGSPVSTDPQNRVERSFNGPAKKAPSAAPNQ